MPPFPAAITPVIPPYPPPGKCLSCNIRPIFSDIETLREEKTLDHMRNTIARRLPTRLQPRESQQPLPSPGGELVGRVALLVLRAMPRR